MPNARTRTPKSETNGAVPAARIVLNSDLTVTVPLVGKPPATIGPASVRQITEMFDILDEAERARPPVVDTPPPNAAAEEKLAYFAAVKERDDAIKKLYRSTDSPWLVAFVKMLALFDVEADADSLYAWAMNGDAFGMISDHLTDPSGGPAEATT